MGKQTSRQKIPNPFREGHSAAPHHRKQGGGCSHLPGLEGVNMAIAARTACLAGTFDDMTSRMLPKEAGFIHGAENIIQKKGMPCDPILAETLSAGLSEVKRTREGASVDPALTIPGHLWAWPA